MRGCDGCSYPTDPPIVFFPGSDPADTFVIDGLIIRGGYRGPGYGDERDPATYETILSGDLFLCCTVPYATQHVVTVTPAAASEYDPGETVLDGFIIEGGYAYGASEGHYDRGGGIFIDQADPQIINCLIRYNWALAGGGGIFVNQGAPSIEDCRFENNYTDGNGGAVCTYYGDPDLEDCVFSENSAAGRGGALAIDVCTAALEVSGCEFYENESEDRGGALYVYDASPELDGCTFEANAAPEGGGAFVHLAGNKEDPVGPHFDGCDFVENTSGDGGGAGVKLQTNVLAGQEANDATLFEFCDFVRNWISFDGDPSAATGVGAGMSISGSPEIRHCNFVENGCIDHTGIEIEINGGGVGIRNYVYIDPPDPDGGGEQPDPAPYELFHTAEFFNCQFRANGHITEVVGETPHTDFICHGGGVYIQRPEGQCPFPLGFSADPDGNPVTIFDARFYDCDFVANQAGDGAGAFLDRGAATLDGCRFMDNDSDGRRALFYPPNGPPVFQSTGFGGGGISTYRLSYIDLTDCIFARNIASAHSGGAIYVYEGTTMNADRCYFVGNAATRAEETVGNGGAIWVDSHCLGENDGCGAGHTFVVDEVEYPEEYYAICNVYNSLFVGNYAAEWAGAVYIERGGRTQLVNCTIMNNSAGDGVGGVLSNSMPPAPCDPQEDPLPCPTEEVCLLLTYNCIIWGNTDTDGGEGFDSGDQRGQLYEKQAEMDPPPADWPTAGYSCIQSTIEPNDHTVALYEGPGYNIGDDAVNHHPDTPTEYVADTWGGDGWDGGAVYNVTEGTTTFTDYEADFSNLQNLILVTYNSISDDARSLIIYSDGETMIVLGDLTAFDAGAYSVESYRLFNESSPCADTGEDGYNPQPYDILGNSRSFYGVDMGCYEITYEP